MAGRDGELVIKHRKSGFVRAFELVKRCGKFSVWRMGHTVDVDVCDRNSESG